VLAGLVPDEKGVTVCPGYGGATNWYSPSYDVQTGMFYFRSLEACSLFRAKTEKFAEGQGYYSTGAEAPVMANPPDSGMVNAFHVETLEFAWRMPLAGPDNSVAGVISTAGGVVAFGNDNREFEVTDAVSGKKLWAAALPAGMHASPMAYAAGGREYFAVSAGDDVIAFGLK
jgi:alcohol dehydrogenase (cytochrome c)